METHKGATHTMEGSMHPAGETVVIDCLFQQWAHLVPSPAMEFLNLTDLHQSMCERIVCIGFVDRAP